MGKISSRIPKDYVNGNEVQLYYKIYQILEGKIQERMAVVKK